MTDGIKQCSRCSRLLPVEAFHEAKGNSGGRHSHCRDCRSTRKNQHNSVWTPELLSRLHEFAAAGLGPTAIAREMQMTKNTISGKMWREGLEVRVATFDDTNARLDAMDAKMDVALGK